ILLCSFAFAGVAKMGNQAELVNLFSEWRAFQRPRLVDGVPDYRAAAMHAQRRELRDGSTAHRRSRAPRTGSGDAGTGERVEHRRFVATARADGFERAHRRL